jgi:hypothetical protein
MPTAPPRLAHASGRLGARPAGACRCSSFSQSAARRRRLGITSFRATYTVSDDGSVTPEDIRVDFGCSQKHGISAISYQYGTTRTTTAHPPYEHQVDDGTQPHKFEVQDNGKTSASRSATRTS